MRYSCAAAALLALSMFTASGIYGQGAPPELTIGNYQLISELRSSRNVWFNTYSAKLMNTGAPLPGVTATLTSLAPNVQVVPGQGTLHFRPAPANTAIASSETFTILVDRDVPFDLASLQWSFLNPVANAGPNQTVAVGSTVTLNGGGSSNPSGAGTLAYSWSLVSRPTGSNAALINANAVTSSFVVDVPGSYVANLVVSNGTTSDSIGVVVNTVNSAPVAMAGPNQTVAAGSTVALNGSGSSDVDGDPLSYFWTLASRPADSTAFIASARSVTASLAADKAGVYIVQLVVNDGNADSAPSTVRITTANTPPVANAGGTQMVAAGDVVQLNGAGSTDVDGDALSYRWTLLSVPAGSTAALNNSGAVNPNFTANLPGTYVAQLIVNDGTVDSAPSTVTVTTTGAERPTANAGPNQSATNGATVTLSGSGSDPQGLPLTFTWSLITRPVGSAAVLSSNNIANPTLTADKAGVYVAQLIVSNGSLSSDPSTVTITTANTAPVANAGPNQNANSNATVTLDGGASSDADNDALSYSWTFTSRPQGSNATLLAASTKLPAFVADMDGTYVAQLIVNDGVVNSAPATVTITVGAAAHSASVDIIIPGQMTIAPDSLVAFPISLAAPAQTSVVVQLTSSDPSKATLTLASVTFDPGQTLPSRPVSLNTLALGTTTITASANGLATATSLVTVGLSVTLTPPSITVGTGGDGTLTLQLSGSAPSTINFTLSSSNPGVATVPPTAPIPTGGNIISFKVTGVAAGSTVVTASAPGFPDVTSNVTVLAPGTITLSVSSTSIQITQVTPMTITLSQPAPSGGVTVNLTNSDPIKMSLSDTSVFIPAGGTTGSVQLTALTVGSPSIGANALNYTAATPVVMQVGTVIAWVVPSVTIPSLGQEVLLDLRMFVTVPGSNNFSVLDGLEIDVTSSNPGVAITPAVVHFYWDGSTVPTTRVQVTSVAPGTTTLHASGTNIPDVTMTVIVTGSLSMSTTSLPAGSVGVPYSTTVVAGGGTQPYQWSATGLPNGLTINNSTGQITGIPTGTGSSTVQVTVSDTATPTAGTVSRSFTLTVNASVANSIAVAGGSPQSTAVNTVFGSALKAIVKDANNNPLSGLTVTFAAPASGASGAFVGGVTTAVTDATGVATSAVFAANGTAGSYSVTASTGALSTSFALTNTSAAPASISMMSGSPQSAAVNSVFANPLRVLVKNASNNPVSGATVTFAVPVSGAGGSFAGGVNTAVTDATGVATSAVFTANGTIGSYSVTGSVGALLTTFSLTNTVGNPAAMSMAGGSPQSAAIGSIFAVTLKALVKDAGNNPVSGVTVTFAPPASGAGGAFAGGVNTAVTDATGVATAAVFTANGVTGSYTVTASAGALSTSFSLTNTAGNPASISMVSGSPQSAIVNTAFANRLKALVKDAGNNPVAGATVTFAAPGSGPSGAFTGGVNTAVTDGTGVATSAVFTANGVVGSYAVTASIGAPSVGFALANTADNSVGSAQLPVPVSVSPASGSGLNQTFTFTYDSPTGAANLGVLNILINKFLDGRQGCYIAYVPADLTSGTLLLVNDAGDAGGPFQVLSIPSNGVASNSQCTINGAGSSVSGSGNTLTLALAMSFGSSFAGNKVINMAARDNASNNSGWQPLGAWNIPAAGTASVAVVGVNPGRATTASQSYTFTFTDTNGYQDLAVLNVLVNRFIDGRNGCYVAYVASGPTTGTVLLVNDNGDGGGPFAVLPIPSAGSVQNSQCSINGVGSSTSGSGNALSLTLPITFSQAFQGNQVIYAAARSNTISSDWQAVGTVTVPSAAGAISLTLSPPSLTLAGAETQNLTLTLSGPAPAGGVTFNLSSNNTSIATVAPVAVTIPANTTATTVQVTGVTTGAAVIRATDANQGASSVADATANITVQPPSLSIGTTSLPDGASGAAYSATVSATGGTQPYHWSATGLPGTLTINNTTGQITGTSTAAGSSSVHITVTDTTAPAALTATRTLTLTVNAGVPASIAVSGGSPQSAAVSTAFANTLKVLVKDASNNPVSGATVTFAAPGSGASGTFAGGLTTAVTDGTGTATSAIFTANGTLGGYVVTASVGALSTSFTLTNTVGSPASITMSSGSPQSTLINTTFGSTLKALVKDAGNNPIVGATVTFAAPGSGASGTFTGGVNTAVTDASGLAISAVFTANSTSGTYAVTASIGALSTNFTLTNTPGGAASLSVAGGSPQTGSVNTAFASKLKVLVKDASNNPVSGVTVTFTAPGNSVATATFAGGVNTAVSDATGVATSAVITANGLLGTYTVIATAAPALSVNLSLTNQEGPPAYMTVISGSGQNAVTNTNFAGPLQVRVFDINGYPARGVAVSFTPPVSGPGGAFAGGQNVVISDSTGLATSAVFVANGSTGAFNVNASVPGISPMSFALTNLSPGSSFITVTNATVGKDLQAPISITMNPAAPLGGVPLSIQSTNTNLVLLSSGSSVGLPSLSPVLPEGLVTVSTFAQGLGSSGAATITVNAPGYVSASATITLTPSGFVLAGPNGVGAQFTTFQGTTTPLTVSAGRLDTSGIFVESQQVRGGFSANVGLASSVTTVGSVSTSSVTINGGNQSASADFLASGANSGSTDISVTPPLGFNTPLTGGTVNAVVQQSGLIPFSATVGQDLEKAVSIGMTGSAASNVALTVTSNDPSKVRFSLTPDGEVFDAINVSIPTGHDHSNEFYVQALSSVGTVGYTATAPGFGTTNGTVTLASSGFLIQSPGGVGAASFQGPVGFGAANLTISTGRLTAGGAFAEAQLVRSGGSVSINVVSSNTSVGTITSTPIVIAAGLGSASTSLAPVTTGSTTVTVSAAQFTSAQVSATFISSNLIVDSGITVGKNLQQSANVILPQVAGVGGVQVTVQSNSALLLLAANPADAGSNTIVVTVPATKSIVAFYVQSLTDTGTGTYTVSSTGLGPASGTANFAKSGIVIVPSSSSKNLGAGSTTATVFTALLGAGDAPMNPQSLAGGAVLNVPVQSNHTNIATVPATIAILPGTDNATLTISLVATGSASISVSQPAGFTTPSSLTSMSLTVTP